jgi:hypothetical protein
MAVLELSAAARALEMIPTLGRLDAADDGVSVSERLKAHRAGQRQHAFRLIHSQRRTYFRHSDVLPPQAELDCIRGLCGRVRISEHPILRSN